MHNKMEIYAEILRQIGRMREEPAMSNMDDMSELDEPKGHHYESQEYEDAEEKGAKMLLGKKAEDVRIKGKKKER